MKKQFLLMALAALPLAGFISCSNDDDDENSQNQSQVFCDVMNSDSMQVKDFGFAIDHDATTTDCVGGISYDYDAAKGSIQVIFSNVVSNKKPTVSYEQYAPNVMWISLDVDTASTKDLTVYSDTLTLSGFKQNWYVGVVDNNKRRASFSVKAGTSDKGVRGFTNGWDGLNAAPPITIQF